MTWTDEQYDQELERAVADLVGYQDALTEQLGEFTLNDFDLYQGTLSFSSPDKEVLTLSAFPLGTYSEKTQTWMWAWSNQSIPQHQAQKTEILKDLAQETGIEAFEHEGLEGEMDDIWTLIAFALTKFNTIGCYVCPIDEDDTSIIFMIQSV